MKRPGYRAAIEWIAEMDSPSDDGHNDPQIVSELVTACMVADIFGVDRLKVGRDVVISRINAVLATVRKVQP